MKNKEDKERKEKEKEKKFRKCKPFLRNTKGIMTVEFAYLLPVIFLVFLMVIYATFYYHDKNIMAGMASETAVLGAQTARNSKHKETVDLDEFFQKRIKGKLILFPEARAEIRTSGQWIEVSVFAKKGGMEICTTQRAAITEPEKVIIRKMLAEQIIKKENQ